MSFQFELQNDDIFSLDDIHFEGSFIQDKFSTKDFGTTNQIQFLGDEYLGDFGPTNSLFSDYAFYQDDPQPKSNDIGLLNYSHDTNVVSPSLESCLEEITKLSKVPNNVVKDVEANNGTKELYPLALASLEILNNYGRGFKRLKGERIFQQVNNATLVDDHRTLSTEDILRIAGTRFIQSSSPTTGHPFEWSFSGISIEETKDVELVEILLSCAEKLGFQQHESATRMLNLCEELASNTGNPIQRVVYYFCEALREKINRETGRLCSKYSGETHQTFDIKTILMPDAPKLAIQQGIPFVQVKKFVGVQVIIENVVQAKKVHIIDLRLGFGMQWTALMQFLANRDNSPLEILKITAIGTISSNNDIEETGKRLSNFAHSVKLPFRFNVVTMTSFDEESFDVESDETVAVYTSYGLSQMISSPTQLERLMKVIKGLNPCVVVVTEVEANQNSSSFVTRFIETLFYYGSMFDCVEASLRHDETNRVIFESLYCGPLIKNIVAAEGEERTVRNVSVCIWRAFFARFGMEEIELSNSSIEQAKLVAKNFQCGNYCTFEMNGNCLMMGWKGTPLHSISAWRFL